MKYIFLIFFVLILFLPNVNSLSINKVCNTCSFFDYREDVEIINKDILEGILYFRLNITEEDKIFNLNIEHLGLGTLKIEEINVGDDRLYYDNKSLNNFLQLTFDNKYSHNLINTLIIIHYKILSGSKTQGNGIYSIDLQGICDKDCSNMRISVLFPINKYRLLYYVEMLFPSGKII